MDPQEPTREVVAEPSGTVEAPVGTSPKGDGGPSGGKKRRMSRRRKIILIIIAAVIVVVIIASFVTAEAMSTNSSCNSCHEMNPYYDSWSASSHKDAKCVDCHIPPGFPNFVKAKVMSLERAVGTCRGPALAAVRSHARDPPEQLSQLPPGRGAADGGHHQVPAL